MILLCGIPTERPIAMVAGALDALGAPYLWFNQRRFDEMNLDARLDGAEVRGTLRVNGSSVALESVRGVYTRMMDHRQLPELRGEGDSARAQKCAELHAAMQQWLEITPARVINRTTAMASNASKPYQAQLIRRHGFSIPETLITNDPELVHEFRARHGTIVYKSISGIRSIVRPLTDEDLSRLDSIRWCPTQFQQFVPGMNIRVHVIGEEVLATAAVTSAVDYRYASRDDTETQLEPIELSDELRARCVALAASLGLEFAGIDLKRTDDGEIYCFEVNPSPGFSYFESSTGQPIAHAVARALTR
jgi:glutathione synthase/RimK-type ligase-like ATP-grasp enzyme